MLSLLRSLLQHGTRRRRAKVVGRVKKKTWCRLLTRVRTFLSRFDPTEHAISLLEFRQEELPQINRKFDDIQCEIELIASDDLEGAELERDNFESKYFLIRSQIQEIINQKKG